MSGRRRPRAQKRRLRQPRTLRTRLVVSAVALIAVVCAVIGTVTTIALQKHLYEQLDGQLGEASARATGGPLKPGGGNPDNTQIPGAIADANSSDNEFEFLTRGPSAENTVAAVVENGGITQAVISKEKTDSSGTFNGMDTPELTEAQTAALGSVSKTGEHTVELPGLGEYRVTYKEGSKGNFYVAIPTKSVTNTINTLILVEVSVTGAGLVAAAIAGSVLVGVALRPLRKVASTATRVSELPCTAAKSPCTSECPSPRPTRTPRSARSVRPSTGCSTTSTAPCTRDSRARRAYASSSRTRAMSCVRHWRRSADTPS